MSAATSVYTTLQQLMLTMGIVVSAMALSTSVALHWRDAPLPIDFSMAYLFVAGVALFAPLISCRLDADAGAELSGHGAPRAGQRAIAAGAEPRR